MDKKKKGYVSEWKPFSELKKISNDISELGYKREYVNEHKLEDKKDFHWGSDEGPVCFFEPLEVINRGNDVFWRVNEDHVHKDIPGKFETQFGVFNNHNHGEFHSWLGKDDYDSLSEQERETNKLFGWDDFFVEGNYCDMFDLGEYCYAVSNLMHGYLGTFKIIRINKNLEIENMYDNYKNIFTRLEYAGRFQKDREQILLASGSRELKNASDTKQRFQDLTLLFCIDENGNCDIQKEWRIQIASSNSLALSGKYVFFGQNKMITRLDTTSGEVEYYTDKSDEELSALVKGW